jgi:hypothetical protein
LSCGSLNRLSNVNDARSRARHNHQARRMGRRNRQPGSRKRIAPFRSLLCLSNGLQPPTTAPVKKASASASGFSSPMRATGGTARRVGEAPDYTGHSCRCTGSRRLQIVSVGTRARIEPATSRNGFSEKDIFAPPKDSFGLGALLIPGGSGALFGVAGAGRTERLRVGLEPISRSQMNVR